MVFSFTVYFQHYRGKLQHFDTVWQTADIKLISLWLRLSSTAVWWLHSIKRFLSFHRFHHSTKAQTRFRLTGAGGGGIAGTTYRFTPFLRGERKQVCLEWECRWSDASRSCPREGGRPTGWTCNRFLVLFRAAICPCGGDSRKQFGWIVKRMNDEVNRANGG